MTFYAHLNLLSAIIMGLAVVKLLKGLVWMVQGRQQIKVYWVHVAWIVIVIFGQFVHYWHIGNLRNLTGGESYYGFADMLLTPIFAYLVAALLIPPSGKDSSVNLQDFYYENRAWIFGVFAMSSVTNAGLYGYIVNRPIEWEPVISSAIMFMVFVALAVTRNKWFHMAVAIIALLSIPFTLPN